MSQSYKRDGCADYKREYRSRQSNYESPPPPPPEVLQCSVCQTAENDGTNVWSGLPYLSYSALFGPTIGDILVHVLNMLPVSVVSRLGIGHDKLCRAKPQSGNASPSAPNKKEGCKKLCCTVRGDASTSAPNKKEACMKLCCTVRGDRGDAGVSNESAGSVDSLSKWMHDEYENLARELADLKRLTSDDDCPDNRDLLQSRNYVLDCLAEMLTKREEIEKRIKKKKKRA